MPVQSADRATPPTGLATLAERYDPEPIDVPGARALIRLRVEGGDDWDAHLSPDGLRLIPARDSTEPDAVLSASAATWRSIADDVRGGMRAFRTGRLKMRGSLHLGVGFLAATAGSEEPGRLAFETLRTRGGRISIVSAGTGRHTLLCLHGLGGTKA
jgi:hypothetical protein